MKLFIYGTLQDAQMLARIAGGPLPARQVASLRDHQVYRQAEAPLPYLAVAKGQVATGILCEGLSPEQLRRLDIYETAFGYHRQPVCVQVGDRDYNAEVYFPASHVMGTARVWSYAEWDRQRGNLSREMASEIGQYAPPLTPKSLADQWHMIAKRATARLIAGAQTVPQTRRYAAQLDDVAVVAQAQLHGRFFKAGAVDIQHRTFAGTMSAVLPREYFVGTDASMVLPYDPQTDHVLLVEQIRLGPMMRADPNPWMLEPIAGMIDAGETPQQAARREAQEEAALTDIDLRAMGQFYASPGNSTDYFHCFLGLCHLPQQETYTGGLVAEAEDLRLHILPFCDAMELLDSGEIAAGPLVAMLLWLARKRDGLRAGS